MLLTNHDASTRLRRWAISLLLVSGIGCAARTIEPRAVVPPSVETDRFDSSDWGLALSRAVVGTKVDYAKLLENPEPLERFLARMAQSGPVSSPRAFPDRDSQLSYFINCYNAMVVRSILALARDGVLPREAPADIEDRFRFRVDGRRQTPADLRRLVRELAGEDWRVRLALCDGRRTGPPLPRHAFLPEMLDAQLQEVARSALAADGVVTIDHGERKRLLVWRGIFEIKDRLLADYARTMHTRDPQLTSFLLAWADRPRRGLLNSAIGYDVVRMPDSAELNAVSLSPQQPASIFSRITSFSFIRPQ